MVKFSCFNAHIHNHRSKKTGHPPTVTMQKMLQDCSQIQPRKETPKPEAADQKIMKAEGDKESQINSNAQVQTASPSVERDRISEEMKMKSKIESDLKARLLGNLKKSQSLGSALYMHGKVTVDDMEDETEEGFSCDGSYNNELAPRDGGKFVEVSLSNRCVKNPTSGSFQVSSGPLNNESIFLIEELAHHEKDGHENSDTVLSGDYGGGAYGDHRMPSPSRALVKSSSLPNISSQLTSEACPDHKYVTPRSRSSEDLHVLVTWRRESLGFKDGKRVMPEQTKDDNIWRAEKNIVDNSVDDCYDSYNYAGSAKDWVMPVADEVSPVKIITGESSAPHWEQVPNKDFKIKRIEEWVTDIQYCDPVEETGKLDDSNEQVKREPAAPVSSTDTSVDGKATPGMEAAKRYISSLSSSSTTAQLPNHGLVVIPFLSALTSLRVLNLSGNAIVRITAGSLPRGLHMLNLSKNYISTIEGLRELTRLRVLDLSYNKIFRIGHGLASCSSLKELYLAGNKISEVEGLHRLLKLAVLDLRFNKIPTAKCLGQLAANYNSLQAISLEGNPAQKNVGDEQLKKSLQSLLPNLVYYNRQPTKVNALKDNTTERSVRLGSNAHQHDRGLSKGSRKGSHGSLTKLTAAASTHGRRNQAAVLSPKPSRSTRHGGHGRLPPNPTGTKAMTRPTNYADLNSKIQNLKAELAIRRSRSEGTLAAH